MTEIKRGFTDDDVEKLVARVNSADVEKSLAAAREASPRLLALSFTEPARFRARVEDSFRLTPTESVRTVRLHYTPEKAKGGSKGGRVVCVLRPVKGRELRGFHAHDRTGAELRVLGSAERRNAVLVLTLSYARQAFSSAQLSAEQETAVEDLLARLVLCEPSFTRAEEREYFEAVVRSRLEDMLGPTAPDEPVEALLRVASLSASRDPVLIEIGAEDGGPLTYTQLDLYRTAPKEVTRSFKGRYRHLRSVLARALGAVPNEVFLPVYKGSQSGDYFMEVEVPEGGYVEAVRRPSSAAANLARGVGTPRALVGKWPGVDPKNTHTAIVVRQQPSGSLFRSLALSLLVLGVVIAVHSTEKDFSQDPGEATALEALSWATGIASVAFVAAWAVLLRTVGGMPLEIPAICSGFLSSGILVLLIYALATDPEGTALAFVLLITAAINATVVALMFTRRLVKLRSLLAADAARDLEGPYI